jgi:hypothetical protein
VYGTSRPELDQLRRRRGDDHVVEELAQAEVVEAPGRGGQADDGDVRVAVEDVRVRGRARVVALVDDDERRARQVVEPAGQRRDRGDLDARPRLVPRVLGHQDPVVDAVLVEAGGALVDELLAVREEEHVALALDGAVDHLRGDRRLAGPGGRDQHDAPALAPGDEAADRRAEALERVGLVGVEDLGIHAPRPAPLVVQLDAPEFLVAFDAVDADAAAEQALDDADRARLVRQPGRPLLPEVEPGVDVARLRLAARVARQVQLLGREVVLAHQGLERPARYCSTCDMT